MLFKFQIKKFFHQFSLNYLIPTSKANDYYTKNIRLYRPIEHQFAVREFFLLNYLHEIKLLKENATRREGLSTFLILFLFIFNLIHLLSLFVFKLDENKRIMHGEITSLIGGKATYSLVMEFVALNYGMFLYQLLHFPNRNELKWIEVFDCLCGNLPPKYFEFDDEQDKTILKKGKI